MSILFVTLLHAIQLLYNLTNSYKNGHVSIPSDLHTFHACQLNTAIYFNTRLMWENPFPLCIHSSITFHCSSKRKELLKLKWYSARSKNHWSLEKTLKITLTGVLDDDFCIHNYVPLLLRYYQKSRIRRFMVLSILRWHPVCKYMSVIYIEPYTSSIFKYAFEFITLQVLKTRTE